MNLDSQVVIELRVKDVKPNDTLSSFKDNLIFNEIDKQSRNFERIY